jgi:hypothetical protein
MGVLQDFFNGNFSAVWDDIIKGFHKLPKPVQDFIVKLESDEGQLLQTLAEAALAGVIQGGFSTAAFVAAGKSIVAQAAAQGKTILISDAMAQINILAAPLNTTQPTAS